MIRLGIVGCNYGRNVLLPAFSADPRCKVVALAGSDAARTVEIARVTGIKRGFGHWGDLVEHDEVDAVAIATPPSLQPDIAIRALQLGKPVFAEKPMAANPAGARAMHIQAVLSSRPTIIDFEFPELPSWRHAKALLDESRLGALRHVSVTWHVENTSTRTRQRNWKTLSSDGGGVLGNFASHCFHYLEYFCGPLTDLSARLSGLSRDRSGTETTLALAGTFTSGAALALTMSCASYLGSGHRIEFYGEDGVLVLINTNADYVRGFELWHARRPAAALERIAVGDPLDNPHQDGRIAPVSRLATRFLEAIEKNASPSPSFAEGYRVQCLLDVARRSHENGRCIKTPLEKNAAEAVA